MNYFDILFAKNNGISKGTCYNEIEAMLKSTVGHSSKNLLDLDKHNEYPSGMTVSELDADTGSIVATATGYLRSINYLNTSLGLEPNDGASYIVSLNNNEVSTNGRLTIRSRGDNRVRHNVSLRTVGKKELKFTADPELFPSGWYISLLVTGSGSETASIDVSGLMLREASISDDTFEPFVTPTDEKKQDKPVVLWEAALNSTGVSEVAISSFTDNISNYSYLKVVVTNELNTTITDQDAVTTVAEYDTAYIGKNVVTSNAMLGMHSENGALVFDRLFIWVYSEGTNITVRGLRNHNDTSTPPDVVSGLFIRKIIGIPK